MSNKHGRTHSTTQQHPGAGSVPAPISADVEWLEEGRKGPPSAARLAVRAGLELRGTDGGRAKLRGTRIYYDATANPHDQERQIARCIALWALRECDARVTVNAVRHVARAIAAPAAGHVALGFSHDATRGESVTSVGQSTTSA